MDELSDRQFMRYSRQLMLEEIGPKGQLKLLQAKVLIVGIGGLGSSAAFYLSAAGVGHLTLADGDTVELSNLQRQILFDSTQIGHSKTEVGAQILGQLNPEITLCTIARKLEGNELQDQVATHNLVLDCSDNFATRHQLNHACVQQQKPLISGAAIGWQGQLYCIAPHLNGGCYHCLYSPQQEPVLNCQQAGVMGPVVGCIGSLQALQALKLLSGVSTGFGTVHLFDAKTLNWQHLNLPPHSDCPVCGDTNANYR